MHKIGDTVRFLTYQGGENVFVTGVLFDIVNRDDDCALARVLDDRGRWIAWPINEVTAVTDPRMRNLRALDASDPDTAETVRMAFLAEWKGTYSPDKDAPTLNIPTSTRKASRESHEDKSGAILEFIDGAEYPVSRREIQTAIPDLTDAEFLASMRRLKSDESIVQIGERRGASYGIPGKSYADKPVVDKAAKVDVLPDPSAIIAGIRGKGPMARADLMARFGISTADWPLMSKALSGSTEVQVTGAKRGTRYTVS